MRNLTVNKVHLVLSGLLFATTLLIQQSVHATPFGQGVYGANNPFGSQTSLAMALDGDVSISLTPSGPNFAGTGTSKVTVTSNDAVGYYLYASAPAGTAMTLAGGGDTIPASTNSSPAALAVNSWGYNTNGSSNYVGMLTTPTIIKNASGPYTSGDATHVTYGALTDAVKSAGSYSVGIVYTVVAQQD